MAEPAEKLETVEPAARATGPKAGNVQIERVTTARQRDEFLELPYRIYAGDPNWVPPLLMERRDFLDPAKNPFFKHATTELFLARKDGKLVGRIATCEDRNYNAFHDASIGFFGFYEALDDDEVAHALFAAARSWIRGRGLAKMEGPANFTSNHDLGLLVDGFDSPPVVMMTYNPRYYIRHFEEVLGLPKSKDLYAWWLSAHVDPPDRVVRIAEKVRAKEGVVVRPVNLKDFANEARRIKEIYNAAWEKNWGFVPFTEEEFDHAAKDMKQIAVADLVLMAEVQGEPVAFSMTLPDMNQALLHVGGRLTTFGVPVGLAKLLWHSRKIDQLRLITLGIKEKYRKRGLDAILYLDTLRAARKLGYKGGEISWTLEDNVLVNRAIEMMGGKRYKTYRMYEAEV
ncbi:N-acetyltransferase [Vulgatibacter sp.]|uniref:N-acetyltransferase n=1 Tax=Vulgatibacter sp. TaxID=1971226 RepID=UPI00356927E8